ncbi:DUF421 domain-containing protein [Mobilitalea sibirica]|uniref:DUF421 domain-containing protein n=1 Tax=Mobilitalea sibirica TaxID=1462919 RepID=A0A8J7H0B6_9FIRM|nr:DUF421 domain-containing protein [Mobilitalea sibirica]MBH1941799.1 DUF421 domain-containing protein [Mobilitalea sibirica]
MLSSGFIQHTIDLVFGLVGLFIVSRVIRKTQINQVSPFDFISSIVLGELLGNAVYDEKVKIWSILYSFILWTILMLLIELITQKFRKSRKVFEGEPAIIIRNGQFDYQVMKREKLDINELQSMLRQKDVFTVREVEYGILEQNGALSIIKKPKYDKPTLEDMNLPTKSVNLPTNLILDGEVLKDNLKAIGFDEDWLIKQLHKYGMQRIEDVFYAEWKKDEGIHVVPRNKM